MSAYFTAIVLGLIEGVTEFLPVSSTGHLLIAEQWLPRQSDLFNVVIQCGAVLAVLAVFWRRSLELLSTCRQPQTRDYLLKLGTAFALTAIGGLALTRAGFKLPKDIAPVAWATLIGGFVIFLIEWRVRGRKTLSQVTWPVALAVAAAQLLAASCPGTSRSGATILVAMGFGLARAGATEFSFLLGMPTMFAAGGYELLRELRHGGASGEPWGPLLVGTLVATATAFVVVKWLLRFVQSHTFVAFAWYRIVLGIFLLVLPTRAHTAEIPLKTVSTLAGTGVSGRAGDSGPAARAQLGNPYGLVRGPDAALYVCEVDNHIVRRIARDGTVSTVAGNGSRGWSGDGGPALQAQLNEPYEVRFDRNGNMLVVEMKNHLVRRVEAKTRAITTIAGTGQPGFGGDGGPATKAQLNQPHSIQLDAVGHLFICDIANHRIRRVDAKTGVITTFAGTGAKQLPQDGAKIEGAPLFGPRALDFDRDGNLWLALREGNAVYKLDLKAGTLHHVAGTGKQGFTGNGGPARQATLSGPKGLSIGPDGNVYFADTESHSIRRIDVKHGTLELIAGTGERGDGPDGDPLKCQMARPHGIFVDADGAIHVGDSEAHRVRVLR